MRSSVLPGVRTFLNILVLVFAGIIVIPFEMYGVGEVGLGGCATGKDVGICGACI